MILTTHALTGAVIGKYVKDPWLVVLISLVVHYAMDSIRHAEYFDDRIAKLKDTWWKVALDLLIPFSIIYFYIFSSQLDYKTAENIILGSFFSVLPDGLTLVYWFSGKKYFVRIKEFHSWAHRYNKCPKHSPERQWSLRNATNDIIISAVAVLLLFL